jgi:hypothetical protein
MGITCYACGKTSKGNMPIAKIDGEERSYCADCYWKLEKQYKGRKTCEECAHFSDEICKKTNETLVPVTIGFNLYYVRAENCGYLSTDKEAFIEEIKKLEAAGCYEEATIEYEKLGMKEEAEAAEKKITSRPKRPFDKSDQVQSLVRKGKTLTYYCCHCGAPVKIGAKSPKVQKTCPNCKGDLEVIDLIKLIKQHPQ